MDSAFEPSLTSIQTSPRGMGTRVCSCPSRSKARIMVDVGAQCVHVVDSAGPLVLETAQQRVQALAAEIGKQARVGFHGHQNLSVGVADSVLAYRAGVRRIDGARCALGACAGNAPTEVLAATFQRIRVSTGA